MKRVFGQELLENASSEIQALLQREEKKIKQRMEKKKSKMSQKFSILGGKFSVFGSFFDAGHRSPKSSALKKHSVNPIITILFVGMAIKTWRSFSQRKINGELLPNDSLPFVEEEEEEEEEEYEVSNPSKESSESFDDEESPQSDSPSSLNANLKLSRRNADKNDEESGSESDSKSNSKRGSSSSGSSMQSIDLERIRNEESKRGRRLERFSQINLIKGFLWNKLEGRPDPYRSSNMFVNFLSMHSNLSKTNLQGTSFRKNGLDENSLSRR